MRARVQRWGNSLVPRIPKAFATETALESGSEVELTLDEGRLMIAPLMSPSYSLDDLLAQMTPENPCAEVDTGSSAGVLPPSAAAGSRREPSGFGGE